MKIPSSLLAALVLPLVTGAASAAVFVGQTNSGAVALFTGNILPGGYQGVGGNARTEATIEGGTIRFGETTVNLPSYTWSGSQTYLDPDTLQQRTISYSISTTATSVQLPATNAYLLQSDGGNLNWMSSFEEVDIDPYVFSGTFTLTGPTETVTGSFSHSIDFRNFYTQGSFQVTGPDTIALGGQMNYEFEVPSNGWLLIDEEVDGIDLDLSMSGPIAQLSPFLPVQNTLTLVPEPASLGLDLASGLVLLRRRRD